MTFGSVVCIYIVILQECLVCTTAMFSLHVALMDEVINNVNFF